MILSFLRAKKTHILFTLVGSFLFVSLFDRGGLHYPSYLLLSLLTLLLVMVCLIRDNRHVIPETLPLFCSLAVFVVLFLFSYLFSQTPHYGFPELTLFVSGPIIFYVFSRQQYNEKQISIFLHGIVFLAVLTSLLGIVFFLLEPFNRLTGTFRNFSQLYSFFPNALANFLVMAIPLSAYLAFRNQKNRFFFLTVSVFLTACLFLTFSRGALLVFGAQILIAAIWLFYRNSFKVWTRYIIGIAVLALCSFLLAWWIAYIRPYLNPALEVTPLEANTFEDKLTLQSNEGVASVSERKEFWIASLKMIRDTPLFGTGADSFRFVYPSYQRELLVFSDHPHNILLKLGVEHGVLVLVAFVIFLIMTAVYLWKFRHRLRSKQEIFVFFVTLSLVGGFLHNMVDYNFNFTTNAVAWWVFLGITFSFFAKKDTVWRRMKGFLFRGRDKSIVHAGVSTIRTLAIVLPAIFLFASGVYEGYFTVQFRQGSALFQQGRYQEALDQYQKADKLLFKRNLYVDEALAYQALFEKQGDQSLLLKARDVLTTYLASNQWDAYAFALLGWVEQRLSKTEYSLKDGILPYKSFYPPEHYFLKAISLDPLNHFWYYQQLMQEYLHSGSFEALKQWFPRIDTLLNQYQRLLVMNAHLTILTDNPRSALQLCFLQVAFVKDDILLNEYKDRCIAIQQTFELEAKKFEKVYGTAVQRF